MYSLQFVGAYIEITSICNRHCPYCYNDSSKAGVHLPKAVIGNILDECLSRDINHVTISGGEPFLHPEIDRIIDLLDEKKIKATFITNLSVVPTQRIIELAENGHLFQVTLDHITREINDLTRGFRSYDLVMELLQELKVRQLSKSILLRYNISKSNYQTIEDAIEIATQFNVRVLDLALLTAAGRAKTYDAVFSYQKDQLSIGQVVSNMKELKNRHNSAIQINYSSLENQVGCVMFGDGEIPLGIKIESNGDVYACQLFSGQENVLGNIVENTIQTVLESKQARSVIDRIRLRKEHQTKCKKCGFTKLCMCGCPAVSYNQTEDIFSTNDQCSLIKFFMKEKIKEIPPSNRE